jgi:hypothetical protein
MFGNLDFYTNFKRILNELCIIYLFLSAYVDTTDLRSQLRLSDVVKTSGN